MADITELINRYFVQAQDMLPGEPAPSTSQANRVEYLIDGDAYFAAIDREITRLLNGGNNPYFYIANWWLGLVRGPRRPVVTGGFSTAWTQAADFSHLPPFTLNIGSSGSPPTLISQLEGLTRAGVDVRAMAWISPLLSLYKEAAENAVQKWGVNMHSLLTAHTLRQVPGLANKVVLNLTAHPLGAMHLKMVVCGDDSFMRAYISGLDFVSDRHGTSPHANPGWHDLGVQIEGAAASGIYNYFRLLWNEQIARSSKTFRISLQRIVSHVNGTPVVPERTAPPLVAPGTQHVQVLRTAPQMNFAKDSSPIVPLTSSQRTSIGFKTDKLNFAKDGIFEFRAALYKAIAGAERYIYIEDQAFMALEVMELINQRLQDVPGLKVIMLHGADPADPENIFLPEAIDRLVLSIPTPLSRVAFCVRGANITVHSKVTIIDDVWAAVGSANYARRSLYTDMELSVGILDEASPSFAQRLRKDVWGEHCGLPWGTAADPLLDLDAALGLWNPAWGTPPTGIALLPELQAMILPFEYAATPGLGQWQEPRPVFDQLAYDQSDPDSRQEL